MLCKWWGPTPKKSHLISPLSTNTSRHRRGRTRDTWSSKYRVGCGGQPRATPRSHRRAPQSQHRGLEAQQRRRLVLPASSRHTIHLRPGMVTMRSRQLLFSMGRDEGAEDLNCFGRRRYKRFVSKHGLSMQWRQCLANPRYHLILHWKIHVVSSLSLSLSLL
jgi:hypothetical protein